MSKDTQISQIEVDNNEILFHFTDIEGRWHLLERAIERFNVHYQNQDLRMELAVDAEGHEYIKAPQNVTIIFGGDATDKGDCSRRIQRLLINTKNRAIANNRSEKVLLIGGNRDYNQVRYFTELNAEKIRALDANSLRPEWVERDKVTFADFKPTLTTDLHGDALLEWQYLEWMNVCTMGRAHTIAFRRAELQREALQRGETGTITDAQVLASFKDHSLSQEYLELTQVATKIGNTTAGYKLVVHGGLSEQALTLKGVKYTSVESWIEAVNAIMQDDIRSIYAGEYPAVNGFYSELERLALPNGKTGQVGDTRSGGAISFECWKVKSVILSNGEIVEQKVPHIDASILAMFVESDIYGMVTGHKSTADSELGNSYVVKLPNSANFALCTPDISFAKDPYNKNVCVALYQWSDDGIISQLVAHSNALNQYIVATLPITGKGAPAQIEGPYVGGTLYAPDLNQKLDDGNLDPKLFAWQILLCETSDDGHDLEKIILQRMDGKNAVQLAYDVNVNPEHKEQLALLQKFFQELQAASIKNAVTTTETLEPMFSLRDALNFKRMPILTPLSELSMSRDSVHGEYNSQNIPELESERESYRLRCCGIC